MAELDFLAVDLDLLDESVVEMTRCGNALDVLLGELAQRVDALQVTWSGAAALAQDDAQTDWEAGFRQMREALASMRTAGRVAHGNYLDAATTNVQMWEQVS